MLILGTLRHLARTLSYQVVGFFEGESHLRKSRRDGSTVTKLFTLGIATVIQKTAPESKEVLPTPMGCANVIFTRENKR